MQLAWSATASFVGPVYLPGPAATRHLFPTTPKDGLVMQGEVFPAALKAVLYVSVATRVGIATTNAFGADTGEDVGTAGPAAAMAVTGTCLHSASSHHM